MDKYTDDRTVIAAAENHCVAERQAGRAPVFSVDLPGVFATWRQRRLYESAMTAHETRGSGLHALACQSMARFRFEAYGQC